MTATFLKTGRQDGKGQGRQCALFSFHSLQRVNDNKSTDKKATLLYRFVWQQCNYYYAVSQGMWPGKIW
jgi:hypothetical protein